VHQQGTAPAVLLALHGDLPRRAVGGVRAQRVLPHQVVEHDVQVRPRLPRRQLTAVGAPQGQQHDPVGHLTAVGQHQVQVRFH
jgi:hypothetical protein